MTNQTLLPFTVVGIYADNNQILCDHVLALDGLHAFAQAADRYADRELNFVSAHPGHLYEDTDVFFPGESLVGVSTVLEQPEIFGAHVSP